MFPTPKTVTVLYADHAAMRAGHANSLFKISCLGDAAEVLKMFSSYKQAFDITPIPGMGIEDICEECFDRGNLDQPLVRQAGRCMSVGDVVRIGLSDGTQIYRLCAGRGWTPITPPQ